MPNVNDVYAGKYYQAAQLEDGPLNMTIDHAEVVLLKGDDGRETSKVVVFFTEGVQGFVCNKTNALEIAKLAGTPISEQWDGTPIQLFGTEVQFGSKMVPAIRVRAAPDEFTPPDAG